MQAKINQQAKIDKRNRRIPARPCPICGRPASLADRPFCSPRCADVDLHRWLSGAYALPVKPDDDSNDPGVSGAGPD
jgi:uncharacterized protein